MIRFLRVLSRRVLYALPQLLGVTVVTFVVLRLLPGNPARLIAGQFATEEIVASIERTLGLDRPILAQYVDYLSALLQGDLGASWFTTRSVNAEFAARAPATLELVSYSIIVSTIVGLAIGLLLAGTRAGNTTRSVRVYAYLAGALPVYWIALGLSFVFFFKLGWFPAPFGRLGPEAISPPEITGFLTIDSLISGNWRTLWSSLTHLALPVLSLALFYGGIIGKLAAAKLEEELNSGYARYARACGLSRPTVLRYALWNSVPPLLTLVGLIFGAMLGGAVLVESVFSWNGLGTYLVDSVVRADYYPVQAFILGAAVLNLAIYLVVDVVHMAIDPRYK